jgi:hypothetical protein
MCLQIYEGACNILAPIVTHVMSMSVAGWAVVRGLPTEITHDFLKGKKIAHRFDEDWFLGTYKYTSRSGARAGYRGCHYSDDNCIYFHELNLADMGITGCWVVVRKIPITAEVLASAVNEASGTG